MHQINLKLLYFSFIKNYDLHTNITWPCVGRYCSFSPPPFFMIDYDREFHADSEKYKNIALKINGKCSNSMSKF